MKLWKHQQELVDLNPDRYGLWWGTGTGKSLAMMTLCKNKGGQTLVICPKSIVKKWQEDVELNELPADVYSKEQFKKHHKTLPSYDNLIVDEAHFFSNYKAQLTKSLELYIKNHKPPRIYFATATPYLSSSWNVFTYLKLFSHDISWYQWNNRFFTTVKMGPRTIPVERKSYNGKPMSEVMGAFLKSIGGFVKMEDVVDVPEQIFQKEHFTLTAEQRKAKATYYDILPIVRLTRELQIENGTLKVENSSDYLTFKSEKFNRTIETCKEEKKVVIVCRHRAEMYELDTALKKNGITSTFLIHGDTKDRHEVVKQAEAVDSGVVIVNASCSEGYELPSYPLMLFYSMSYSYKDYVQIKGRILRMNKLKSNVYRHLIVEGGVDEQVYKTVAIKKQDFNTHLTK